MIGVIKIFLFLYLLAQQQLQPVYVAASARSNYPGDNGMDI